MKIKPGVLDRQTDRSTHIQAFREGIMDLDISIDPKKHNQMLNAYVDRKELERNIDAEIHSRINI